MPANRRRARIGAHGRGPGAWISWSPAGTMDPTLIAVCALGILLLGMLALLWRLRTRVDELEEGLRSLAPLNFLPDRTQALTKQVEALDLEPLAKEIERLAAGLQRVEDLAVTAPTQPQEAPDPIQVARATIVRTLRDEGFTAIRVLAEPEEFTAEPARLAVQAQKHGVLVTGAVELVDGEVGAVDLEPSYSAFP